ncbi:MFS transporter [Amycolatopsis roodepoortensis]|uniref:MFS transporter n=1 Tax=Amycolatopsis roodepoortensis TaxID=700274 RepID=UPI00214D06A2|nr:MFS transporter [Amycolatopsis roodepoortensis]UUV31712.1 MFS transporter [Amycolatopsis roodepoortensis]
MTGERLDGRYAKLWAASTTSALGSGLATVAAPLLIASRTDEPLVVSGGFAVAWLPWLLFSLPGGVLADRVDRRKLMITLDWIRVPAVALLAIAISMGDVSIALLYAVLFVINACEVVFRTSSGAMLPAIVPKALLERANGRLYAGTTLAHGMLSGPLSGFLFGVAASIPFYVNAGTYAVSALLLGLIAGAYRSRPVEPAERRSMRSEVAEGFRWLAGQRLLRTMIGLIGMLNLTLVAATSVLVLLAKERLGLGSVGYGLLFTCMAVGGLLGSVMGARLIAWCTPTWTLRIGLLIEAGTHLVLATSTSGPVVGVTLFLFGVHGALWGIVGSSLRQRLTPPGMLGRVGSTSLFVIAGGNCVGALLGGAVASKFGLTTPYWAGFVVAVIVSALTWRVFDREVVSAAYAQEPAVSR